MKKPNKITVTVYGQIKQFDNEEQAMRFFIEAFYSCDPNSSEASRYTKIIRDIAFGKTKITDEEV